MYAFVFSSFHLPLAHISFFLLMLIFNISFVFIANYLYYKSIILLNNQSENCMNLINKRKTTII